MGQPSSLKLKDPGKRVFSTSASQIQFFFASEQTPSSTNENEPVTFSCVREYRYSYAVRTSTISLFVIQYLYLYCNTSTPTVYRYRYCMAVFSHSHSTATKLACATHSDQV